jgi:hypothetical protein
VTPIGQQNPPVLRPYRNPSPKPEPERRLMHMPTATRPNLTVPRVIPATRPTPRTRCVRRYRHYGSGASLKKKKIFRERGAGKLQPPRAAQAHLAFALAFALAGLPRPPGLRLLRRVLARRLAARSEDRRFGSLSAHAKAPRATNFPWETLGAFNCPGEGRDRCLAAVFRTPSRSKYETPATRGRRSS